MEISTEDNGPSDILSTVGILGIVGRSRAFLACYAKLLKFARCKAPVLIEGETGTGKESAARCLHYLGPRSSKPFIPVNCGALPETMFENELFGHVQGAYTDARSSRDGLIAQAQHGTLFLDEVDALPHKAQLALLRFLEDRTYRRLGDTTLDRADVNVIAATNADLDRKVADGHFRQDLLFRLATIRVKIPSLRERRSDIPLLADHYVHYLCDLYELTPKRLAPDFLAWLNDQDWPGNIRELQNCLHREFLLTDGEVIHGGTESGQSAAPFTLQLRGFDQRYDDMKRAVLRDFERQYLEQVMRRARGNVSQAARLLGKDRRVVGRLLDKHGIDRSGYR